MATSLKEALATYLRERHVSFVSVVEEPIGNGTSLKILTSDKSLKPFYFEGIPVAVQHVPLSKRATAL